MLGGGLRCVCSFFCSSLFRFAVVLHFMMLDGCPFRMSACEVISVGVLRLYLLLLFLLLGGSAGGIVGVEPFI